MKLLMIFGGLLGFGIGLALSWVQESSWPYTLWRACLSAYLAGLLMRWWGRIWLKSLGQVLRQRQAATDKLNAEARLNANAQFNAALIATKSRS